MGKLPTYKQWKLISEAYGNQVTLGVGTPNSLGIMGSHLSLDDEETIEEAKKKKMLDIKVSEEPDEEKEEKKEKKNPFAKKKDKDGSKEHEEAETEEEEKEEHEDGEEKKDEPPFFKKKEEGKKKKKMTKEDTINPEDKAWFSSLKSMMTFDPNKKFSSGLSEEQLIPPTDPNQGLVTDEDQPEQPQAGEPGFAPQQRIGGWFM